MTFHRVALHSEGSGVQTDDPELLQKYLDHTYSAHFAVEAPASHGACSWEHSRTDAGGYAIEEMRHSGEVLLRSDHVPSVVALRTVTGRVECEYGGISGVAGPGEWVLASTGADGVRIRLLDAVVRSIVLDRSLVAEAAADRATTSVPVIRFTGRMPIDAAMADTLDATERFLHRLLTTAPMSQAALVLGAAGRMVASAVLATFPNDLPAAAVDPRDEHPALLLQAMDFIERNAAHDIGVGDVAAAVYLTPRTVQYMFRNHLGTTPTTYLREVRLAHAREELLAGDRRMTTVAAVAARWKFAHTGRFAVLYRDTYGESPHETLRR
ncbi:transcriptional regulator containing an amidase domain and an AraC-type DNA-binding HTH domain [Mycolicibacterium aurum]|uniref:Transcriptional regulator containing an amidase domain and an AraC-type DNA-binding HTH domain n=1 Tax=Mycolicibacterium aurum TaxID=1791 RepID=A0A448J1U1_MYCAU|nr:helix-turn-helix transcriptional regulator [Mycolicibacterium aurum]VEG58568.1 transcriptional regulator containing an amidase domain and an AraC-type DNA-binding HTH domain [Mycolicibacterium aurum]